MFKDFLSRRDDERQMKEAGRLPPNQSLTRKFPVLHYGSIPTFDETTWRLDVTGEVEARQKLDLGRIYRHSHGQPDH
jgi:DMSO/TMAO reductase YedYZ molybdopterin-dependent catalytic subunit